MGIHDIDQKRLLLLTLKKQCYFMVCVAHYFQINGSMQANGDTSVSMNAWSVLDQQT